MSLSPENILVAIGVAIGALLYGFARWRYQDKWKDSWTPIVWIIGFGPATISMFFGGFGSFNALLGGIGGGILLANWVTPKIIRRVSRHREKSAAWEAEQQAQARKGREPPPKNDQKTGRRSLRR